MNKYLTCLLACLPLCLFGQVRYSVVPLVPQDNSTIYLMSGNGVNAYGDAAGSFLSLADGAMHAYFYSAQGGFMDLGTPAGNIQVTGINNAGQISAYGTVDSSGHLHALRYTPGVGFVDLGTAGGRASETTGINNAGQVTGFYEMNDGSEHAFLYTDGRGMQDLGVLSGQNSAGRGINDLGWVTGTSANRAFIYRDGVGMTDIGPGSGWAINNAGVVAGAGRPGEQAAVFLYGQIQLLGTAGSALGINNNNTAVGFADHGTSLNAFIWSEQDGLQDLNSLIDPNSGWYLSVATSINDAGQIVGHGGWSDRPGFSTAFLLTQIPEPSAWALLALGGLLSSALGWRKRK